MRKLRSARNVFFLFLAAFCIVPISEALLFAQVDQIFHEDFLIYNNLRISSIENDDDSIIATADYDLEILPLSALENKFADTIKSHWVWADNTLDMINSYSPFLFRTKKSAKLKEVRVLLTVNELGALIGFELMNENDKGLKERLDFMIRKMPNCKPVPGFETYQGETFELVISK